MKENQLHQAFSHWLDIRGVPYVHSRTDRRTTSTLGDCDYYVFWMSRVLGLELKVGKNQLSPEQEKRIAYLRRAGNKVVVARSLEECIDACHNILCIKDYPRGFDADYSKQFAEAKAAVAAVGAEAESVPKYAGPAYAGTPVNGKHEFIGTFRNIPWVFYGTGQPGSDVDMRRQATPADLMNLPKN